MWPGLLLVACLIGNPEPAEERVVAEEGYALTRPDTLADWSFRTSRGQDGSHVLQLAPDATGLIDFKIESRAAGETSAQVVRDELVAWAHGKEHLEAIERISTEIAGHERPGLRAETEAAVGRFRLVQFIVIEHGREHRIGYHAPASKFEDLRPRFESILATLRFLPPVPREVDAEAARLESLAARCGSELDWSTSWDEAAAKSRERGRWVLVLVHSLPGFDIPSARRSGLFTDPDLVELIQERFVLLELDRSAPSPFQAQEHYGMGPSTFGTSLLCVDSEGRVAYEVASVDATIAYQELRTVLERAPDAGVIASKGDAVELDTVRRAVRRGELERAEGWLEHRDSVEAHLLRADLLRRQRRGDEALSALKRAEEAGAAEDRCRLERGRILADQGKLDEAIATLEPIAAVDTPAAADAVAPVTPQALSILGACLRLRGDMEGGERAWRRLVQAFPESRFAWPIAAAMAGPAFRAGHVGRVRWPDEDVIAATLHRPSQPLPSSRRADARRSALEYLLDHQRENGAWVSPSLAGRARESDPDPIADAITAICARSLIPERDHVPARRAIEAALAHLQLRRELTRSQPELPGFMDYTVWSHPQLLWLLADGLAAGVVDRDEIAPWIEELLAHLEERQKGGGGWSYYLTPDLDHEGPPLNISMSFTTALVLTSLHRVEAEGFELPAGMVDRGLGCLERMRGANGAYDYLLMHDQEDLPRKTGIVGASGRGPICELALLHWGRGSDERLIRSVEVFFDHRHLLRKEQGKRLMHAGPDGLGSHYPMFDYYFAALASVQLPDENRPTDYLEGIIETILSARADDGSYVDNPMIGRAYATAMALMTLRLAD